MSATKQVDLNCDLGESFGAYQLGNDEAILPFINSANIACGFHAGDPQVILKTISLALKYNVQIGAHPSYPDLQGFGRRAMHLSSEEVYADMLYQISALQGMLRASGGTLQHVKPHGALYNTAARDFRIAEAIAEAVYKLVPDAILFGLAGSELIKAGKKLGLRVAQEVFADRTYQKDGSLTPRSLPHALIQNADDAISQAMQMVSQGSVIAITGETIPIQADTICLHGDHPHSALFAQKIRARLEEAGISVLPVVQWL